MVCRKLRLRPGETVVEVGCGWGALAIYMAQRFGVRVKAYNISHEQIRYAREWAEREGVSDSVEFIEDDYRTVKEKFDVFCSVGMLEHVGPDHYHELGRVIHRAIGDTGRGFLHYIGRNRPAPLSVWIRKRIFPGGYPPTIRESMEVLEPQSLLRGKVARSSTRTSRPESRRAQSHEDPAGPPPTINTSHASIPGRWSPRRMGCTGRRASKV